MTEKDEKPIGLPYAWKLKKVSFWIRLGRGWKFGIE
jgi:hypothetical protein